MRLASAFVMIPLIFTGCGTLKKWAAPVQKIVDKGYKDSTKTKENAGVLVVQYKKLLDFSIALATMSVEDRIKAVRLITAMTVAEKVDALKKFSDLTEQVLKGVGNTHKVVSSVKKLLDKLLGEKK